MILNKVLVLAVFMTFVFACSHVDEINANLEESSSDEKSHNAGENCGSCHNVSGSEAVREAGWWTVAGTVYSSGNSPQTNATIELWEKPNKQGALIKRLVSDKIGNFYTNQIIDFKGGCYPSITVGSNTKYMNQKYEGGSCNSCHGVTTNKLEIN
ncbi:MAG: hypothetical protein K9H61_10025 [Bacteroidia bacterium]|nr:hypothetical protein [Bacteroidia bacterium]MCF8447319.1 hypothetical protein [Bacteroidia bacterium]